MMSTLRFSRDLMAVGRYLPRADLLRRTHTRPFTLVASQKRLVSSRILSRPYSSPNSDETVHPPSQRFDEERSFDQWKIVSAQLLGRSDWTPDDFVLAQEAVRWSTTQRTDTSVEISMQLYRRILEELQHDTVDQIVFDSMLQGQYPQASHLLNAVVDSWRICRESVQSRRTKTPDQILTWVQTLSNMENGPVVACRTYSSIMQAAIVQGGNPTDAPVFCEQVLNIMFAQAQNVPEEARNWVLPDTIAVTTALRAWARSRRHDAPDRAEQLWLEWIQLSDDQIVDSLPNTVTYNTVIQALLALPPSAYQPHQHRLQLQKAQDIMADMMVSPYPDVKPNTATFRILIYGWVECRDKDAVDRACALLNELVQLSEAGQEDILLEASIFSKIMARLVLVERHYSRAESVYLQLLDLHNRSHDPLLEPNVFVKRNMLIAYTKTGRPEEAQVLLDDLEGEAAATGDPTRLPKRGHYSDVARAWCDVGAVDRGFEILQRLIGHASQGLEHMAPDRQLVDDVFKGWSISRNTEQPEQGEYMLRSLVHSAANNLDNRKATYPSPSAFLHVINAWSTSDHPEAAHRAEALLWDLKRLAREANTYPTRFHYSAVLRAWSRQRERNPRHCRKIFDDAVQSASEGHERALPDTALYGAMMKIYSQSGDGEAAEQLMTVMLEDFRGGNTSAKPSTGIANMVLLAWLRSQDSTKAARSVTVYKQMLASSRLPGGFNLAPDKRTYQLLRENFASAGLDFDTFLRRSRRPLDSALE